MNGEVRVVDDVGFAFAELAAEEIKAKTNPTFSIAFGGGSTATAAYEHLAKQDVDWSSVVALWGDERCVPLDHEDSNYFLAKRALFDKVGPLAAVHPMTCDDGASAYEAHVRAAQPIDLIHLGMGDDGHTASLFPGSSSLKETSKLVIETGDDLHKHQRMTLTYPAINAAKLAVFTVTGKNKHEMFARIRAGENLPAAHVATKRIIWLIDAEVAG
jgi:6-phosphogluconolactonase